MGNSVLTSLELESHVERSARNPKGRNLNAAHNLSVVSRSPVSRNPGAPLREVEGSVWSSLASNLRDAVFPKKLPPLHLASSPIAVRDPLASKRGPVSSALSFLLHAGAIALIVWLVLQSRKSTPVITQAEVTPVIQPYIPITMPAPKTMGGGGGGGAHKMIEANKGHLPPVAKTQVAPPDLLRVDHPKLAVTPTVVMPKHVKIPVNAAMPMLGMAQSPQIQLASQGLGNGSGFGHGGGGGIGSGSGAGVGVGNSGGYGGGVMSVGNGVTAPRLIHSVTPQLTDEARRNRYQGQVSIQLIVDAQGNPADIRIVRHLGMGLDQKAVAAVRQYKFAPAMYQGHPVPVQIMVIVDFHMY